MWRQEQPLPPPGAASAAASPSWAARRAPAAPPPHAPTRKARPAAVGCGGQGTQPQLDAASLAAQHAECSLASRWRTNLPRHGDPFHQQPAIQLPQSSQTPATVEQHKANNTKQRTAPKSPPTCCMLYMLDLSTAWPSTLTRRLCLSRLPRPPCSQNALPICWTWGGAARTLVQRAGAHKSGGCSSLGRRSKGELGCAVLQPRRGPVPPPSTFPHTYEHTPSLPFQLPTAMRAFPPAACQLGSPSPAVRSRTTAAAPRRKWPPMPWPSPAAAACGSAPALRGATAGGARASWWDAQAAARGRLPRQACFCCPSCSSRQRHPCNHLLSRCALPPTLPPSRPTLAAAAARLPLGLLRRMAAGAVDDGVQLGVGGCPPGFRLEARRGATFGDTLPMQKPNSAASQVAAPGIRTPHSHLKDAVAAEAQHGQQLSPP
jgi:hypothetical protein